VLDNEAKEVGKAPALIEKGTGQETIQLIADRFRAWFHDHEMFFTHGPLRYIPAGSTAIITLREPFTYPRLALPTYRRTMSSQLLTGKECRKHPPLHAVRSLYAVHPQG
jgi:hypothetical protein